MKNHIENIRKSVKSRGYTPTSDVIRGAIGSVCPNGENILENKSVIVDEVVRLLTDESVISTDLLIDKQLVAESVNNDSQLPTPQTKVTEIIVSSEQKHELVTAQSSVLDVELSDAETIELCSSIPDIFDDYETFISSVTDAIKIFIDEKFDRQEKQSVNNSINDLRQHIATRQTRLDSKFAAGLNEVKGDLEQIRSNLKSRKAAILSRLKINSA
jgi:hypothetical protein